jgi:hypothetical protein
MNIRHRQNKAVGVDSKSRSDYRSRYPLSNIYLIHLCKFETFLRKTRRKTTELNEVHELIAGRLNMQRFGLSYQGESPGISWVFEEHMTVGSEDVWIEFWLKEKAKQEEAIGRKLHFLSTFNLPDYFPSGSRSLGDFSYFSIQLSIENSISFLNFFSSFSPFSPSSQIKNPNLIKNLTEIKLFQSQITHLDCNIISFPHTTVKTANFSSSKSKRWICEKLFLDNLEEKEINPFLWEFLFETFCLKLSRNHATHVSERIFCGISPRKLRFLLWCNTSELG